MKRDKGEPLLAQKDSNVQEFNLSEKKEKIKIEIIKKMEHSVRSIKNKYDRLFILSTLLKSFSESDKLEKEFIRLRDKARIEWQTELGFKSVHDKIKISGYDLNVLATRLNKLAGKS